MAVSRVATSQSGVLGKVVVVDGFADLEKALVSTSPMRAVRAIAQERAGRGVGQEDLYAQFDRFRHCLREAGREADEDVVMDVMDHISGFCSQHNKIYPNSKM